MSQSYYFQVTFIDDDYLPISSSEVSELTALHGDAEFTFASLPDNTRYFEVKYGGSSPPSATISWNYVGGDVPIDSTKPNFEGTFRGNQASNTYIRY